MAQLSAVQEQPLARPRIQGAVFDWIVIAACVWFIGGGYLDSWAHFNIPRLETFFTPWHGVLYSGLLVVTLTQIVCVLINRSSVSSWREAIPRGYELSLIGSLGFFIAGIGDMFWHILFGVEKNIDAQFSPTHVLIFICYMVISLGPYRALYRRPDGRWTWLLLPVAQILFLACAHLFVEPLHPYNFFYPSLLDASQSQSQTLAVVGYLFYGMILSLILSYTLRRWKVPFGFFTAVYTVTAFAQSFLQAHPIAILMGLLQGVLTDLVYLWIKPKLNQEDANDLFSSFRVFAFLLPVIYYSVYFLVLFFTTGVIWTIHLSVGTIVGAGLLGWVLSYLELPGKGLEPETTEQVSID